MCTCLAIFTVGNDDNSGYDSSVLFPRRMAISELVGDPYDIRLWSEYVSNETVRTGDMVGRALTFEILRPKSDFSLDCAVSSWISVLRPGSGDIRVLCIEDVTVSKKSNELTE